MGPFAPGRPPVTEVRTPPEFRVGWTALEAVSVSGVVSAMPGGAADPRVVDRPAPPRNLCPQKVDGILAARTCPMRQCPGTCTGASTRAHNDTPAFPHVVHIVIHRVVLTGRAARPSFRQAGVPGLRAVRRFWGRGANGPRRSERQLTGPLPLPGAPAIAGAHPVPPLPISRRATTTPGSGKRTSSRPFPPDQCRVENENEAGHRSARAGSATRMSVLPVTLEM